jgi:hypothetical protein
LTRLEKEISSWSLLVTGLFGGVFRLTLVLFAAFSSLGVYASLGETVFITLGTAIFLMGQLKSKTSAEKPAKLSKPDTKPSGTPQATA